MPEVKSKVVPLSNEAAHYEGMWVMVLPHTFLTWTPHGGEWFSSCLCHFTPGKEILVPIGWKAAWESEKKHFILL